MLNKYECRKKGKEDLHVSNAVSQSLKISPRSNSDKQTDNMSKKVPFQLRKEKPSYCSGKTNRLSYSPPSARRLTISAFNVSVCICCIVPVDRSGVYLLCPMGVIRGQRSLYLSPARCRGFSSDQLVDEFKIHAANGYLAFCSSCRIGNSDRSSDHGRFTEEIILQLALPCGNNKRVTVEIRASIMEKKLSFTDLDRSAAARSEIFTAFVFSLCSIHDGCSSFENVYGKSV